MSYGVTYREGKSSLGGQQFTSDPKHIASAKMTLAEFGQKQLTEKANYIKSKFGD